MEIIKNMKEAKGKNFSMNEVKQTKSKICIRMTNGKIRMSNNKH